MTQQRSTLARPHGRLFASVGIGFALVLPGFLFATSDPLAVRTTWAAYDLLARLVLFSAPALLAILALFRRPALLVGAAIATGIALPLYILAPPFLIASVLFVIASDRLRPIITWNVRDAAAVS